MLRASCFSTFYARLLSVKLCIMNVEINELNWIGIESRLTWPLKVLYRPRWFRYPASSITRDVIAKPDRRLFPTDNDHPH